MWPFKRKSIVEFLDETKSIKVKGFPFIIRRVNALDYLDGSKVLQQAYALYKKPSAETEHGVSDKKIREFFSHILCSAVVQPKLVLSEDDKSGIFVERLFVDWELVTKVYEEIMVFTYGKKKLKQSSYQEKS
jgi:hypothetical protein